jgi:hypothetical protein
MKQITKYSVEGSRTAIDVFIDVYNKWFQANAMGKIISDKLLLKY